jgi:3-dehydroquinate synthase
MIKIDMSDYNIIIDEGLFSNLNQHIPHFYHSKKLFVITDDNVFTIYNQHIQSAFKDFTYEIISTKPGEESKSLNNYETIIKKCLDVGIKRDDLIIALGGGVVGDLAGFIASTLYRGIDFIQIPTTLLAMVDSSIGGKTGINLDIGKNLIGSFYQPKAVLIDPHFLDTLEPLEYQNGVAEMIKAGLIGDPELFESLRSHNNVSLIDIERSILVKKDLVTKDPFDHKERMYLNFGHTFGHAIEAKENYKIKHGVAISYGMLIALNVGIEKDITPKDLYVTLFDMLKTRRLIEEAVIEKEDVLPYIKFDKKHDSEGLKFVLIKMIGTPLVINIKPGEL